MVATVIGSGVGLQRSSASVLGSAGQIGSAKLGHGPDLVYVNAANGNLVVDRTDEVLIGRGPDEAYGVTYNSEDSSTLGGGATPWSMSAYRRIENVTGTVNTAGSTATRVGADGSRTLFTYDSARGYYVNSDGGGAYDELRFAGSVWTWTDGNSRMSEQYGSVAGYLFLTAATDTDGNTQTRTYDSVGRLTRVTNANGDYTDYGWNAQGARVDQLTTTYTNASNAVTSLTRIRYVWDSSYRLTSATIDLSPGDNSVADGNSYATSYTYDGTSNRLTSISEADGSHVDVTYVLVGSDYRVSTMSQVESSGVARVTSFSYDTVNRRTTVTDPNGQATSIYYDAQNQLIQLVAPPPVAGAASPTFSYAYNANGDVTSVTDGNGNVTSYSYDSNGNVVSSRDAEGNSVTRTYGASNELLTETSWLAPDPDGAGPAGPSSPVTTRYAYDSHNHLRFRVSAEGRVVEYRYNGYGQQVASLEYNGASYDTSALGSTAPLSEATLASWAAGLADKSAADRTDTTYDARGNVSQATAYSKLLSDGSGDLSAEFTRTTYVYDLVGNLLTRQTSGVTGSEAFVYDGLGRITSSTDAAGSATSVSYADASSTTTVTLANGLVRTSVYNKASDLITSTESASGIATATTSFQYDHMGRLRATTDATGRKSYILYDNDGRKTADITPDGALTEYQYDSGGRLTAAIGYATKLSSGQIASLTDGAGNPASIAVASVRPAADPSDVWNWRFYDHSDRLAETVDGTGAVTLFAYDGDSRLISTTQMVNRLASSTVAAMKTASPTASVPASSAGDRTTRNFYDNEGRGVGVLDGAGGFAEDVYDAAGRKVRTIAFATAVPSSLRASGTFAQIVAAVGTSAADRRTDYVYDGRGLLRYTVDGNARPTQYMYDQAGHLIRTLDYAAPISAAASYSLAYVDGQVASLASNPANRLTRAIYDGAGRLAFSIDSEGGTTELDYDSVGNVVKQTRFATAYPTAEDPSLATMQSWAWSHSADAGNRVTRTLFDAAGRLVYTVDAEGYVSQRQYDTAGRVTSETRHPSAYAVSDGATVASVAAQIGATSANAAVTSFTYDSAGRMTATTDPEGIVTSYTIDALGRTTEVTVAYGTADAATLYRVYDAEGHVVSETKACGTAEASTSTFAYDGTGNLSSTTDARGATTSFTYDSVGRVLTRTVPLNGSANAVTTNLYDALGNLVKVTDPRGNSSFLYYDKLGRVTLSVDAEGYATRTAYSGAGNEIASVTHYATRVAAGYSESSPPSTPTAASDATTSFTRDRLGRVTATTDAENKTESYTLNAFGQRTIVTNKIGGTTLYAYDRRGLTTSKTLYATVSNSAGTTVSATTVTNYYYDSRGNLTQMVEGAGLAEQRTTLYAYDKLDRLISKSGDAIVVTTSNFTTYTMVPTESYSYDNAGRLIQTISAAGARTLSYYDHLGRKTAEVSPVGTLSAWTYDANGNVLSATVYGDLVTLPGSAGGTPPAPVNATNYRQTTYTYDAANRLLQTRIAGLRVAIFNGVNFPAFIANVASERTYDAAGNVVQDMDARGYSNFYYYDKLGRKVATVDKEGYLTSLTLDAEGNAVLEERFATKLAAGYGTTSDPVALRASVAGNAADRVTDFTYDRNGRRLQERRYAVGGRSLSTGGALNAGTDYYSVVTYTYNELGLVTRKSNNGDYIDYSYDTQGRQTAVQGMAYSGYGGTATPRTETYYDGLGNVVLSLGKGTSSANNRATTYSYGPGGRLASVTDATGFTHSYGYDADGHVSKDAYSRQLSSGAYVNEAVSYAYDPAGRLVQQMVWDGSAFGDVAQMRYNSYGELSSRGVNNMFDEVFEYDKGGRLTRTTSGDGTPKFFLYDEVGNRSATFVSTGANLETSTTEDVLAMFTNNGTAWLGSIDVAGVSATIEQYDKRGQSLETLDNFQETAAGAAKSTVIRSKSYNAFGEVASETDARGYRTDYSYNNMGRLIQTQKPTVTWVNEAGTSVSGRPTENYYYDTLGRLIATSDANGYVTTRRILAGTGYDGSEAKVTAEYHPDQGVLSLAYDEFGDLRQRTDEIGRTTSFSYDKASRLIETDHAGGLLSDYYSYDGLGQRTRHWNSFYGSSYAERTDYDAVGRLTYTSDMAGYATSYSYAWSSAIATIDIERWGGWVKTTTNGAGLTASESDDLFGHVVSKTDFGGHTTSFTYDKGGRLTQQSMSSGGYETFSYFNTGKVAQVVDTAGSGLDTITSTFAYDVAGNRTYEGYSGTVYSFYYPSGTTSSSQTLESATMAYDGLGRMTSLSDSTGVSVTTDYDAAGNVRRVQSTTPNLVTSGSIAADRWYRYDSMNRMVVADGILSGGQIVRGSGGGEAITYDAAGQRITSTRKTGISGYVDVWINNHTETVQKKVTFQGDRQDVYTYRDDGYLMNVAFSEQDYSDNGNGTASASYDAQGNPYMRSAVTRGVNTRDALGRVTSYQEMDEDGVNVDWQRSSISYDARNLVTSETTNNRKFEGTAWNTYVTTTSNSYNGTGFLTGSSASITKNGVGQPGSSTTNAISWWDEAKVSSTSYTTSTTYTSTYYYDGEGRVASVDIADGRRRTVSFADAYDGRVLLRKERSAATTNPEDRYYYADGIMAGHVTNNGAYDPSTMDYATSMVARTLGQGTGAFRYGSTTGSALGDVGPAGYQPINDVNQAPADTSYTVHDGETLQAIAQNVWGDASMWYLIAEANGLSSASQLTGGTILHIPAKVTNVHDNATTFKVYDPNKALGDLQPNQAAPVAANKKGCGIVGKLLLVAIAVAVTVVTSGALTAAVGPVLGGALAGAAGSLASQTFGLATGLQSKFDFKGLAMAAIAGGIGGGMQGANLISGLGKFTTAANDIVRGALTNALTQGVGVATGLQKKFDWAGVATAGVVSGVAGAVSRSLPGRAIDATPISPGVPATNANTFASSMAGGVAGAATRSLLTGTDFGDNLIAVLPDVVAATVGNVVAREQARSHGLIPKEGDPIVVTGGTTDALPTAVETPTNAPPPELKEAIEIWKSHPKGLGGELLDLAEVSEKLRDLTSNAHPSKEDLANIRDLTAKVSQLKMSTDGLNAINNQFIDYAVGKSVIFTNGDGTKESYEIKGPSWRFDSKQAAARDGIALSFFVTSITGDGFERSGVIFDAGGGKYRYGNLWVGAYTDHEVRLGGAAIPAGLPFSTVSLRDKAAVAYFHIHPDNGVLNSYDNSKFSDHDADFFRQAIRNHKNLSEMYLGGSDGSFVQMTRQLVESTIFGHHYFDVPRTSLPRVILRPSFGRE